MAWLPDPFLAHTCLLNHKAFCSHFPQSFKLELGSYNRIWFWCAVVYYTVHLLVEIVLSL